TNIGSVTAQDPTNAEVSDSDPANYFGAAPGIDTEKSIEGDDADSPTGPFLAVGDTAHFVYEVTNTGNVALTGVTVTDDQGLILTRQTDPVGNNDNVLDVGETWQYTASATVTAGQYTNIGSVTA